MGFMVLCIQDLSIIAVKALPNLPVMKKLFLDPQRAGLHELRDAARCHAKIRLEDALKFQERLVVETDVRQIFDSYFAKIKTILDRIRRERSVALLARETFLLSSRDNLSVAQKARCTIVVERGNTQYVHASFSTHC